MEEQDDHNLDAPPRFKSWKPIYWIVVANLLIMMVIFYFFSSFFA